MNWDIFGLFASTPAPKSVAETVREAKVKRRAYERALEKKRAAYVAEMSRIETELRAAVRQTDKTRGKPLLKQFKALELSVQRIDMIRTSNDLAARRLDAADVTEQAMHIQRINSNALHRVNTTVSAEKARAPLEKLSSEVKQFDETDAEIRDMNEDLLASLGGVIEGDDVTDDKWEEWVAMDAQMLETSLPPEDRPDELEQAINDVLAHKAKKVGAEVTQ